MRIQYDPMGKEYKTCIIEAPYLEYDGEYLKFSTYFKDICIVYRMKIEPDRAKSMIDTCMQIGYLRLPWNCGDLEFITEGIEWTKFKNF